MNKTGCLRAAFVMGVEEVLFSHPDILEVAVVGVPDEKWGETVKAFIVCKPGKSLTEEEVFQLLKQHLALLLKT